MTTLLEAAKALLEATERRIGCEFCIVEVNEDGTPEHESDCVREALKRAVEEAEREGPTNETLVAIREYGAACVEGPEENERGAYERLLATLK